MPLLTKSQLARELAMPATHVQTLTRQRKIPVYRLSSKCIRYDLERVKEALARFEVCAVDGGGAEDGRRVVEGGRP